MNNFNTEHIWKLIFSHLTRSSSLAEKLCDTLVSRNLATTNHPI